MKVTPQVRELLEKIYGYQRLDIPARRRERVSKEPEAQLLALLTEIVRILPNRPLLRNVIEFSTSDDGIEKARELLRKDDGARAA